MNLSVFVVDTSYLLELYKVPGFSNDADSATVRRRFKEASRANSRFYVPFPVIFELANHIAHIRDGTARQRLADRLFDDMVSSHQNMMPWVVVPAIPVDELLRFAEAFKSEFARQSVGLTDVVLVEEARRLKRERYGHRNERVHIWTKDRALNAFEPDPEPSPFLGT